MSVKQKSQDSKKKMSEIDDQILKSFDIKKRLGKGAYGIVWKAIDKKTEQTVAVKKIFDAFRNVTDAQRTFREIMFLRAFRNHPNIIQLHSVHKAFNHMDIYLSFEFMESDLHNVIKRGTILKDVHKRYVMYQLFNATKYIHSGNVIHRDLKPSNVLIDSRCRCKIADFGLARSVSLKIISGDGIHQTDPIDPILTDYVATRWYRAPEILVASKRYTKGIDLWSLGCILGEMIRGKPLFPGSCTVNQVERIVSALPNICEKDIIAVGASFGSALLNQTSSNVNNPKLDELLTGSPEDAKLLVKSLLVLNPNGRLTAKQALLHKYIEKFRHASPEPELSSDVIPPFRDDIQLSVQEYRSKLYELMSTTKVSQANSTSTSSDNQNNNNSKQQQQQKQGNSKYLSKKIRDNNIQQKLESTITVSSNNNNNTTNSSTNNGHNKKSIYSKIQNQNQNILPEQNTKTSSSNNLLNDQKQQQRNCLDKKNQNYTPTVSCIALEGVTNNQQNYNNNSNTNYQQQYINQTQHNLTSTMNGFTTNLKSIDTNNRNRNIINNNDLITINTNNINSINNKQTKLKYCKIMNYADNNNVNNVQNINNNQKMLNKQRNQRISGGGGGDRTGINLIDRRHSIDCSNYKSHQKTNELIDLNQQQQNSLPNFTNSIDVTHLSQLNSNDTAPPILQHTKTDLDNHLNDIKRATYKLQTVSGITNTQTPPQPLSYLNKATSIGTYKGNSKLIIKDNNNENNVYESIRNNNNNSEYDNEAQKKQQQQQQQELRQELLQPAQQHQQPQDLFNLDEHNFKKSAQPDYYENRLKTLEEKIRRHKMDIKSFLCQNNKLKISKLNNNNNSISNNNNNNNNVLTGDAIKTTISQVPEIRRRPIYTSTALGATQSEHNIRSRIELKCTKSDNQQQQQSHHQQFHHHHHHHHQQQHQSNPIKFEYTFSEGDYCSTNKNITHNINNNNNNNNNNNHLKLLTNNNNNNKSTNYGVISSADLFKLRSSEILS